MSKERTTSTRAAGGADSTEAPARVQIRVPKTAELVAQQIRRQIIRGELEEGTTLRPETELMGEFGVSRPTLREAFRVLESESLISVTRGSRGGARVHAPAIGTAARYAGLFLQHRQATLADVQATRELVEPPAARLLAGGRSPDALRALREIVALEKDQIGDPAAFAALSTRFHELVAEHSRSQTLAFVVGMLGEIIRRHAESSLEGSVDSRSLRRAIRSQEKLIALVEAGDADGAEEHWRSHVRTANRSILKSAGRSTVVDLFD